MCGFKMYIIGNKHINIFLFLLLMVALFSACNNKTLDNNEKKELTNSEEENELSGHREQITKQEYLQYKEQIDMFCKTLNINKEELSIFFSNTEDDNNGENGSFINCCISSEKVPKINGSYMLSADSAYKELTNEEMEQYKLTTNDGYDFDTAYYAVYESGNVVEDVMGFGTGTEEKTLQINDNKLKKYTEKLYGTYKIIGCTRSEVYLNTEDRFSVCYVDFGHLYRWYFSDGRWKLDSKEPFDGDLTPDKAGRDGTLWELRDKGKYSKGMYTKWLYKIDKSGKEYPVFKCNEKWKEKNGYTDFNILNYLPLLNNMCILIFEKNHEEKFESCLYDLSAGKIIKKYDFRLDGIQDGDYIYHLRDDSILDVYDFNSGEYMSSVDVSIIKGDLYKKVVYYEEYNDEFCPIDWVPYMNVAISANNNKVYLRCGTGMFEWKVGDDTIYHIMDGENTRFFDKMYGTSLVAADGTIYILGEMAKATEDDCSSGVSDLLVMTPIE